MVSWTTDFCLQDSVKDVPKNTGFKCSPKIVYSNSSENCSSMFSDKANFTVKVVFFGLQVKQLSLRTSTERLTG